MAPKGTGIVDIAYQTLKDAGHPISLAEIAQMALDRGLVTSHARDPIHSLVATIRYAVTQGLNVHGFVLLEEGQVGLADWGGTTTLAPSVSRRRRHKPTAADTGSLPNITLEKLERIRHVMSPEEFRKDWGELYDYLGAQERAKWITAVTDRQLGERTRAIIQRIHGFLQGSSTETPKSDAICDWIFICYTLELHREGAALWRYVNKDEIDALKYERTAKFSTACRTRVG
jgi:hypothetical protein